MKRLFGSLVIGLIAGLVAWLFLPNATWKPWVQPKSVEVETAPAQVAEVPLSVARPTGNEWKTLTVPNCPQCDRYLYDGQFHQDPIGDSK